MEKITFSKNVYLEAFSMIGRGFTMVAKETGRLVNKAIHRQPYIFMGVEALVLMVFALVLIGNARAERDYESKRYIGIQAKADCLQVTSDMWRNVAKGGSNERDTEEKD